MMESNAHFGISPATRPIRNKVTGNMGMKLKDEFRRKGLRGEYIGGNGTFNPENPLGQQWRQLGVA
jgi:hypothetical protein